MQQASTPSPICGDSGHLLRRWKADDKIHSADIRSPGELSGQDQHAPFMVRLRLDNSLPQGLGYGSGVGIDVKFVVDASQVSRNRVHAYAEGIGDFLLEESLREKA